MYVTYGKFFEVGHFDRIRRATLYKLKKENIVYI